MKEALLAIILGTIAAAAIVLFNGCMTNYIYIDITDTILVSYAKNVMKERHPTCAFDQQIVLIGDETEIEAVCHQENIFSCFYTKTIFIREDIEPMQQCEALLHEFNHAASLCIRGDWDQDHTFDPQFYTETLFTICSDFTTPVTP